MQIRKEHEKLFKNFLLGQSRRWHPKILGFWVWYLGFPPKPKPKNPKFKPKPKPRIPKNLGPKTQKLNIFWV
jgi:hypothetical protein